MRIVDVKAARRLYLIDKFLEGAGESLKTFGYYSKRDLSATDAHLVTLVGFDETFLDVEDVHGRTPVAYGHLDQEEVCSTRPSARTSFVWLGICVASGQTGKGFGDAMMRALLARADENKLYVRLGVHLTNPRAIEFYRRYGFEPLGSGSIPGRPDLLCMGRRKMADTVGSLVDKLATINNKLFVSQDMLYEIRRMQFETFKGYFATEDKQRELWELLQKTCDLNFQRSQIITEVDEKIAAMIKRAIAGEDLDDGANIQRQHKTY